MAKFAFWVHGLRGTEFQVLHDEPMNNEWDRSHGVAPPKKIAPEHEEMSYHHLRGLYPEPPPAPMPKVKRQEG